VLVTLAVALVVGRRGSGRSARDPRPAAGAHPGRAAGALRAPGPPAGIG